MTSFKIQLFSFIENTPLLFTFFSQRYIYLTEKEGVQAGGAEVGGGATGSLGSIPGDHELSRRQTRWTDCGTQVPLEHSFIRNNRNLFLLSKTYILFFSLILYCPKFQFSAPFLFLFLELLEHVWRNSSRYVASKASKKEATLSSCTC